MKNIDVYGFDGKPQDKLVIDFKMPENSAKNKCYSFAIKRLLQNWRQGTVSCKGRSDVSFSNKKPWKQKGTGRARAGSLRSPLWRKGGAIFGPKPRTRRLFINKKQSKLVLSTLFKNFFESEKNNIFCLDYIFSKDELPKTKKFFNLLKSMGIENKKITLFIPFDDELSLMTFRNLPNVNILSFDQPNAFDLSNTDCWMFFKKDLNLFKEMVEKWN